MFGIQELQLQGFEIHEIDRGGEVTYHGPGQIILYPIVNLRLLKLGARAYVESLEDVMVRTLGAYGLSSRGQIPGRTGVWIGDAKIGAVGVRISNGVRYFMCLIYSQELQLAACSQYPSSIEM